MVGVFVSFVVATIDDRRVPQLGNSKIHYSKAKTESRTGIMDCFLSTAGWWNRSDHFGPPPSRIRFRFHKGQTRVVDQRTRTIRDGLIPEDAGFATQSQQQNPLIGFDVQMAYYFGQ